MMDAPDHLRAAREALLAEIAAYCAEHRIGEAAFGKLAVGDNKFVSRLRAGENMTTGTITRVHEFIIGERSKAASPSEAA